MTTDLSALHAFGALATDTIRLDDGTPIDPCRASNIQASRLEAYARLAIATFVPSLARHPMVPQQLSLFDFSERTCSNRAAVIVDAARIGAAPGASAGGKVLVTRVGDALQVREGCC